MEKDRTLSQIIEEHCAKVKTKEEYDEFKRMIADLSRSVNEHIDCVPNTGLTSKEDECMLHLTKAFGAFHQLPVQRKKDMDEFVLGVHQLQRLIAIRHLRREYPNYWVSDDINKAIVD